MVNKFSTFSLLKHLSFQNTCRVLFAFVFSSPELCPGWAIVTTHCPVILPSTLLFKRHLNHWTSYNQTSLKCSLNCSHSIKIVQSIPFHPEPKAKTSTVLSETSAQFQNNMAQMFLQICQKNMATRGRWHFSLFVYSGNFKNLLVRNCVGPSWPSSLLFFVIFDEDFVRE